MNGHSCNAVIVSCIDFRLQPFINQWISENFQPKTYDRVALAGGVKNWEAILNQVKLSHRLHHIQKVVLLNHEDCGAYGEEGSLEKHSGDLNEMAEKIKAQLPDLEIEKYYLHLDGTFKQI